MPDEKIAWARATVLRALGGSRFEVKVERPKDAGLQPKLTGVITVDLSRKGFEGLSTLPLQVRSSCDRRAIVCCLASYVPFFVCVFFSVSFFFI